MTKILITGGAGFVGSNLAIHLKETLNCEVTSLDNLHRRGSELNIPRLKAHGVTFIHGDTRVPADIASAGDFSVMIDASAEPSVMAGIDGNTEFVMNTNLTGTLNCLEHARKNNAQFIFLSTSRVYPVARLCNINYTEGDNRFEISSEQSEGGISARGISEDMKTDGTRTLYGTSKLASELLVEEYGHTFNMPNVINRCGVIAGPWQMGKVDQGILALWVAQHHFKRPLKYIGFGGSGKQVRDVMHVSDLASLVKDQIEQPELYNGTCLNAGGGIDCSFSLKELTEHCENATGSKVDISSVSETRAGDVPIYISDCSRLFELSKWRPAKSVADIVSDTAAWVRDNEEMLREIIG